jgi:hypothetical protein
MLRYQKGDDIMQKLYTADIQAFLNERIDSLDFSEIMKSSPPWNLCRKR